MTNDEIIAILREHPELIPEVLEILTQHKSKSSSVDGVKPKVTFS